MQYWESNPGSQALAKQNFKTEVINSGINGENYKKIRQTKYRTMAASAWLNG